jgi:hypothetical protein
MAHRHLIIEIAFDDLDALARQRRCRVLGMFSN